MGTKVRVINESNGKSEVVTINDRGPFVKGRIIDVTIGAAERLGFVHRGVAKVRVEVLGKVNSDGK
jgi:rare lipoprotein A